MSDEVDAREQVLPLQNNPCGSVWHRWDPHIHAPGIILADQYGDDDPWEEFMTRIEQSDPPIRALGVTDYLSLDLYEQTLAKKNEGRLRDARLIFPNIEMRLAVTAGKGSPINVHLLISPEDEDHVDRARRLLAGLTFQYNETYHCQRADLIALGKAVGNSITDDDRALEIGTNQFKVNLTTVRLTERCWL